MEMYRDTAKRGYSAEIGLCRSILYLQSYYSLSQMTSTQVDLEGLFGLGKFLFGLDRSKNQKKIFASEVFRGYVSWGVPSAYREGATVVVWQW